MTQMSPISMPGADVPKRPKGILKNSYHHSPPGLSIPPSTEPLPQTLAPSPPQVDNLTRVETDQDITLANTVQNAGHRRTSSNPRRSESRRQSSNPGLDEDPLNPRLKWDEVNLYLTEQEKSSTMKIDEPKTPYAKHYEPGEDEEEMRTLDAADLKVDELDQMSGRSRTREAEIPGLELGDPEESYLDSRNEEDRISRSSSTKGEKQVIVEHSKDDAPHGENVGLSAEEREKHRKFEELRKKHYEMKDVKGLLGHPEELEDMDEDDDSPRGPALLSHGSQTMANGL